jgi:hypothetical protein
MDTGVTWLFLLVVIAALAVLLILFVRIQMRSGRQKPFTAPPPTPGTAEAKAASQGRLERDTPPGAVTRPDDQGPPR